MWVDNPAPYVGQLEKTVGKWFADLKQFGNAHLPVKQEMLAVFASYLCCIGLVDWMVQRSFMHQAADLYLQWTIAFRPLHANYNSSFITYLIAVAGVMGAVVGLSLLNFIPLLKTWCVQINEKIWLKCFGVAVIFTALSPFQLTRWCFFTAAVMYAVRLFLQGIPEDKPKSSSSLVIKSTLNFLLLLGAIGFSGYLAYQAWYPVVLTNDYMELPDTIQIPASNPPVLLSRQSAINCIINRPGSFSENSTVEGKESEQNEDADKSDNNNLKPKATSKRGGVESKSWMTKDKQTPCETTLTQQQVDLINIPLQQTGNWQSQSGRTLYHHSYVYVPVAHLLKYGLSESIPYLYGLGNTAFYAWLLQDGPVTLSHYFEIFPIAQLAGILAIVLCVFFITDKMWSIPAAFAAVLIPLFCIGYENIQLAPGFNPLRYAGMALQIASIFYVMRKPSVSRALIFLAVLAFSMIWNKEFAILALFGQMITLMSPQLRINAFSRFTLIAMCCTMAAWLMTFLNGLSKGFLETIQVGIFGIAVPPLENGNFLVMCFYVIVVVGLLWAAALRFNAQERAARLATIPVLCLLMIKFVYNASPVHLLFTLAFIAPLSLIYLDWKQETNSIYTQCLSKNQWAAVRRFMVTSMVGLCLIVAVHYQKDSVVQHNIVTSMFVKNTWSGLNETFQSTSPAEPVVTRIKAIQEEMKPDDAVLFLSPFDHLMSFYTNPKSFCGHFEYLTNLVTYDNIASVTQCASANPHALVVYDDAIEQKCLAASYSSYSDVSSCKMKKMLTQTMQTMMDTLKHDLVLVKKVGSLSFYRHRDATLPPASKLPVKYK